MDQETYLSKRIEDQIKWYDQKSKTCQNKYKTLKVIVIIASVSIPFLVGMIKEEGDILKIVVGIIGVFIAAIEGILSLYQYKDLWLKYRLSSEMLQREKYIFLTKAGIYADASDAFKQFVNRSEAIMNSENQSWLEIQQKAESTDSTKS